LIERLQVYEGNIELEVPTLPGVRTIEGLEVRLSGEVDAQGLRAQLRQVTANMTPADLSLEQVQGGFEILAGKAQIDGLRFQMGDTLLTAAGVVPWSPQPTSFELHLQPLDMAEIGRLLQNNALRGQVRLAVKAEGPPEALAVSADLGTGGGRVELHGEVNRVSAPLRYQATLDITKLDLTAVIRQAMLQSDINLHARVECGGLSLKMWSGEAQLDIDPSHLGDIVLYDFAMSTVHELRPPGRRNRCVIGG
jgi:hypothetical protein